MFDLIELMQRLNKAEQEQQGEVKYWAELREEQRVLPSVAKLPRIVRPLV